MFKPVLMPLTVIDQVSAAGCVPSSPSVVKSAVSCQGDDQIDTVPAGFRGDAPANTFVTCGSRAGRWVKPP